jgi:gamma-glutamylcyclotransferase (GGCT)/AIG2-like uncharacterized protein YtfP
MSDHTTPLDGGDHPYFAYGSNMDAAQMAVRCKGHVLVGAARLADHRFMIMERGFATVVPAPGEVVHGVVWALTPNDEKALDYYEGVRHGHYARELVRVTLADGGDLEVLTYVASDTGSGTPKESYIGRIVAGAIAHGLPEEYVATLREWGRSD